MAAAARYYQKAVAPKDMLTFKKQQQSIDRNVAQILSGKEGVSKRQATPEEEKRYIQLIYEQAHRALNNKLTLETALQDFTTTSKDPQVIAHVATLRTIFCLAWNFHLGTEAWQEVTREMIGHAYFEYIDLKQMAKKIYDLFQEYYRFRDRWVDDQKAIEHNTSNDIDWKALDNKQSQDLAWTIAKVSANLNVDKPNANYNDMQWEISQKMLRVSSHIELIAPYLLTYLSQIQRGSITHIRATRDILDIFTQTPQIYAALPDFFNKITSLNFLQTDVGFISQSNVSNVLTNYGNDVDRMLSMNQGIVRFLSNVPIAMRNDLSRTMLVSGFGREGILEKIHKSKAMQILTKDQYQEILKATFKEFNCSLDAFKENREICAKFLNLLLIAPIKASELEPTATPVSAYLLQNDLDKSMLQPILKLLEKYQDNELTNQILNVFAQLFNGSTDDIIISLDDPITALTPNTNRRKPLTSQALSKNSLQELFNFASKNINQTKNDVALQLLNAMLSRDDITSKLDAESIKKLFASNPFKLDGLLLNPNINLFFDEQKLQQMVAEAFQEFNSDSKYRKFLATLLASEKAIKHLKDKAVIDKIINEITSFSGNLNWTDPKGLINMIAATETDGENIKKGGILRNDDYEQYINADGINAIIKNTWKQIKTGDPAHLILLQYILTLDAAKYVDEDLLKSIYNEAIANNLHQCPAALAVEQYAGSCREQRGQQIPLVIRQELHAMQNNTAVNAHEIHEYMPKEAYQRIMELIKKDVTVIKPQAEIEKFLKEKITQLEPQYREKATLALEAVLKDYSYGSKFLEVMALVIPWLENQKLQWDQEFKDLNKRWQTYLINSLYESGDAYDAANHGGVSVSCMPGICERAQNVKLLNQKTNPIFKSFEAKKQFSHDLLTWAMSPYKLIPNEVKKLEQLGETPNQTAIIAAKNVWMGTAQKRLKEILEDISKNVPGYKPNNNEFGKIQDKAQCITNIIRPIFPTENKDMKEAIGKTVSQECASEDKVIIATLEEKYLLPQDKNSITKVIQEMRDAYKINKVKKEQQKKKALEDFDKLKDRVDNSVDAVILTEEDIKITIRYSHAMNMHKDYIGENNIQELLGADKIELPKGFEPKEANKQLMKKSQKWINQIFKEIKKEQEL